MMKNEKINSAHLTLRQGLEQFRQNYGHQLSHDKEEITAEAKAFFESHDVAHVLFDCDISLMGEGAVKIWTIFGTTLGFWKHLRAYQTANAFQLAQKFEISTALRDVFKLLFTIPFLIIRAKRMKQRWPWSGFEPYLDEPIREIREAFNIRI